jgi:hypothetical protein
MFHVIDQFHFDSDIPQPLRFCQSLTLYLSLGPATLCSLL